MDKQDEMVAGYMKGFGGLTAELPACHESKSSAWKHGWNNGRDDRLGSPRDRADVLRRRADMILDSGVDAGLT